MIVVCICYSGVSGFQDQWDYVLSHFQADRLYLIGADPNGLQDTNVVGRATRIATAEELPNLPLVIMAAENGRYVSGDASLGSFAHPEDCIYLFGADNSNLSEDELGDRPPDHKVYIRTDSIDDMYSWVAGAITLYDRGVKRG